MAKAKTTKKAAPPMGDLTVDTRPVERKVGPPEELTPAVQFVSGADPETARVERERRRYIRRSGGLKKNLCEADKKRALELCEQMQAPPETGWLNIHIGEEVLGEGRVYDNIEHGARRGKEWNRKDDRGPKPVA